MNLQKDNFNVFSIPYKYLNLSIKSTKELLKIFFDYSVNSNILSIVYSLLCIRNEFGMEVFPSEANYIFFKGPENLFEKCVKHGVLIRDCSNYFGLKKGYYRVAVRTHEENEKLIQSMQEEA